MVEYEKEGGFMGIAKGGLTYISQFISSILSPQITAGVEIAINNIDERILLIEKRILKRVYSSLIIGFGGVFLILSLFFFLIEVLSWSNVAAYFFIGIITFMIGLILKTRDVK